MRNVDIPVWTVGGFIVDGDAQIQIKYTIAVMNAIDNIDYFLVDGKEFLKKQISLRGVPTVNRIVVTLEEKEG
jgi:predicted pyridoxine 5'-phosphate oxidase superfamily flavin-nucleotide-binding protein